MHPAINVILPFIEQMSTYDDPKPAIFKLGVATLLTFEGQQISKNWKFFVFVWSNKPTSFMWNFYI